MDPNSIERIVREVIDRLKTPVKMDLKLALALMERVEEEARRIGVKAVVAVSDGAGRPVAVHCMDGAYIGSYDVAVNKAFTAVAFQMPTAKLGEFAAPGGSLYGIQHTNGGKIVIFGGGEPLLAGGVMVGAIGVSGGSAAQDEHLSTFGGEIFKELIGKAGE